MTPSEITQIVIGILSLLATVAVSFLIYWLQTRHEKEIRDIEAKRDQKELEEQAHVFLSENTEERDYLPWCIMAANLHRHETHTREIYTNYCRCSVKLQTEILKQAGFTMTPIEGVDWVDYCFAELKKDIKEYKLGRDFLYDNAKYFHRGFERYRDLAYELDVERSQDVYVKSRFDFVDFRDSRASFSNYVEFYFDLVTGRDDTRQLIGDEPVPPADLIWSRQGLANAEEEVVCYWMMEFVDEVAINIHNRRYGIEGPLFENMTDAQTETYEDKYYHAMQWLYYTYFEPTHRDTIANQSKKREKKPRVSKSGQKKQKKVK